MGRIPEARTALQLSLHGPEPVVGHLHTPARGGVPDAEHDLAVDHRLFLYESHDDVPEVSGKGPEEAGFVRVVDVDHRRDVYRRR